MIFSVFGGRAPWAEADTAGYCLQAANAPMAAMMQRAAYAVEGAVRHKAIQVLNTLACVPFRFVV